MSIARSRLFVRSTLVPWFVLVLLLPLFAHNAITTTVTSAATSDLFISEYIEGSSNNKAIEIYNGTGAAIDLAAQDYRIEIYFNGNTSPNTTIDLTGTVVAGDVFVVADNDAAAAILAEADQTSTSNFFNGDDAVVLKRGDSILDVIGQIGFDPGSQWGSGDTSTQNNTLRRKVDVCAGDTNPNDAFDPALEWDGFPQDTFDGLGTHTASCDNGTTVPTVTINEIRIDQPSSDVDEYFELAGPAGTALDGLTYLVIGDGTGGSGVIEAVVDLSGSVIPSDGFFVVAESTFTLGSADLVTSLNFENSDNVTHLLVAGFTGANGDDLDTNDDGTLDVIPWTTELDRIALVEEANPPSSTEFHYGPPQIGPDGSFVPGHVFRCPDGTGDWTIGAFSPVGTNDTPGAANDCGTGGGEIGLCGDPATLIHAIQGSDSTSPLVGETVTIEGVVVGDFSGLSGFYVQEEADDVDTLDTTSEGVFVFMGSSYGTPPVSAGNVVRVNGSVGEYVTSSGASSQTQLAGDLTIVDCGPAEAAITPTAVSLPVTSIEDFERYEGMLVTFPQELVISEYFNFDRFGEIVLALPLEGQDRPYQPTSIVEPGAPAIALQEENARRRITLDDGRSSQNPDPAIHPNGAEFTLSNRFRGGDTVTDATGVIDHTFGRYRVHPVEGATYSERNPRPAQPADVGGTLKVASFNVLNYFTTLDTGPDICGAEGNLECRGADNAEEFERQRAKIISALAAIDADIAGLIELENPRTGTADSALADLVSGLNDALGAGTYAFIDTGTIGTDAIKVGFIYKPDTVTPVGDFAILDSSVDPRFIDTKNRPALAQTFAENATGGSFTAVVNHLKSKGSPCDDVGDPNTGDGQGNCNLTRTQAAEALVDWLATDPTGSGDPDFMILGDLNAYAMEDPITAIENAGYTNLIKQFQGELAYSFVFDGQFGYLDHALSSPGLTPQVTGVTEWHINADEPDILDYDTTFKQDAQDALYEPNAFRSSDHDPVIVGLNLSQSNINQLLELDDVATAYDPSDERAAAGVYTITATFNNQSTTDVAAPFFKVTTLTGNNQLLNVDVGTGGEGSITYVPVEELGTNGVLDAGEAFLIAFEIGLAEQEPFEFIVDSFGVPVTSTSAAAPQPRGSTGSYTFTINANDLQPRASEIVYLPISIN